MPTFSSALTIGDPCTVVIRDARIPGHVRAVTFSNGKVRYAVSVVIGTVGGEDVPASEDRTTLHNLDSVLVEAREGERVRFGFDNYS